MIRKHRGLALGTAALLVLVVAGCGSGDDNGDEAASASTVAPTTTAPAFEPSPEPLGEADAPVVVGHRGASAYVADNTIEGFETAAEMGADWVELDVRLSADGVAVLCHDPETADGSIVADTASDELAVQGIPTLVDALATVEARGLGVDVEVKGLPTEPGYDEALTVADETVAVIDEAALTVPFLVSSFNPSILDRVRELTDDAMATVRIFPAGGDAATLAPQVVADGDDGVALDQTDLTAEDIAAYTAVGLPVWVWTVNDPTDAERFVAAGAEAIVTDEPDTMAEALR